MNFITMFIERMPNSLGGRIVSGITQDPNTGKWNKNEHGGDNRSGRKGDRSKLGRTYSATEWRDMSFEQRDKVVLARKQASASKKGNPTREPSKKNLERAVAAVLQKRDNEQTDEEVPLKDAAEDAPNNSVGGIMNQRTKKRKGD